jgi:hypothetical protein
MVLCNYKILIKLQMLKHKKYANSYGLILARVCKGPGV